MTSVDCEQYLYDGTRRSIALTSETILDVDRDDVVLVDGDGTVVGSMPKRIVHNTNTPLHLGFSVYVFNGRSQLLMTRRSVGKATWPGVWTNSFCGHPAPGETFSGAIERRAAHELGVRLGGISPILTNFRYSCTMPNGVRENEICPVFRAETSDCPQLNPDEVDDCLWMNWVDVLTQVLISPWARLQIGRLQALGEPTEWPADEWGRLPATVWK